MSKNYWSTISNLNISNSTTDSVRIVHTPSIGAKSMFNYVQEMGSLVCKRSHISSRDPIDSYLFMMILKGDGSVTYNGETYFVSAGDIAFVDCNMKYSHRSSEKNPWEIKWIHFNGPTLKMLYSLFIKRNSSIIKHPADLSRFLSLFEDLSRTMTEKERDFELIASHILSGFVTDLLTEQGADNIKSTTLQKLSLIKNHLENNFQRKITLEYLSKEFVISKFYLTRQFKEHFGITVMKYLEGCRINHSKKLLRFTSLSVGEIAIQCGFENECYFTKVFKENEGITAGKFRKQWIT